MPKVNSASPEISTLARNGFVDLVVHDICASLMVGQVEDEAESRLISTAN